MTIRSTALLVSAGLAIFATPSNASIIVDSAIESANGWIASPGFVPTLGTLSPNELTEMASLPDNIIATLSSPAFGIALAEGSYTVSFAVGNDAAAVVLPFGFRLSGLSSTNQSTPSPTPGTWALWTAQYVVPNSDPRIGNALTFDADFFSVGGDAAFDGVGALSSSGSGLLIDFVAAVPEPSEAALVMFGLTGFVFGSRRRKRFVTPRPTRAPRKESLFARIVLGL